MRALLSFGVGSHAELLDIALPSYSTFAEKHGYELVIPKELGFPWDRPPSWFKVPLIRGLLEAYDEVLFLGADLVIVDGSEDLDVPEDAWQALVPHKTGEGEIPNADMWLLRKPMLPFLEQIWEMTQYLNHGWWEQRALIDLMGYEGEPFRLVNETELYRHTHFLDPGWNVHIHDRQETGHARINHATMYPDRAAIMRVWAGQ